MFKVSRGTIKHDKKDYGPGEVIPGLSDKQEEKLAGKGYGEIIKFETTVLANTITNANINPNTITDPKLKELNCEKTLKLIEKTEDLRTLLFIREQEEKREGGPRKTVIVPLAEKIQKIEDEKKENDEDNPEDDEETDFNININPDDLVG